MKQAIGYVAVVVRDYDEAIAFYVDTLGFRLVEATVIEAQNKRMLAFKPQNETLVDGIDSEISIGQTARHCPPAYFLSGQCRNSVEYRIRGKMMCHCAGSD